MLLYNSFIECYFNYCGVIWHTCSNADTMKVEKMQEKALRHVTLDFSSDYSILLHECGKSSLYVMRLRKIVEVLYKILNGMYPKYLDKYVNMKDNGPYDMRVSNKLLAPRFQTIKYGKNSLQYMSVTLWNILGNKITSACTLNDFKRRVKTWYGPVCKCGFCILCKICNT